MKHKEVCHFKRPAYYKSLYDAPVTKLAISAADLDIQELAKKARPRRKRKQPATAREREHNERSYHWGPGYMRFQPQTQGWQATCPRWNGSHANPVNPSSRCRQYRGVKNADDDVLVQRALRHWINECGKYATRQQHLAYRPGLGQIPSEEEVEAAKLPDGYDSAEDPLAERNVVGDAAEHAEPPRRRAKARASAPSRGRAKARASAPGRGRGPAECSSSTSSSESAESSLDSPSSSSTESSQQGSDSSPTSSG